MKKVKVLFVPSWEKANPYQRLLKKACESNQCEVNYSDYPSGLFPFYKLAKKHENLDVMHVHWISELLMRIVWSRSSVLFWFKYFLFGLDCLFVRMKGIKLVWTIHNKFAHENQHKSRELSIRKLFVRMSNNVILHSDEALNEINQLYNLDISKKTNVIFHGNYDGCYPSPSENRELLRAQSELLSDDIVLLFFGSLKPYKGIETLISAYKECSLNNIKLYIAGEPHSEKYKNDLIQLTQNCAGISTNFNYLNDQELIDHLCLSDIVVLPFSDTLTSGTAILAMTEGKALALTEAAKVFGCIPEQGVSYFKNKEQLLDIINRLNLKQLHTQGAINLKQAEQMDWQQVGKMTLQVYQN